MKEGKREYNPHASDRRLRGCVGMMGHKEDEDLSHMMRMARGKKGEWNEVRVEGHGKEGWVAFEEDGAHLGERVGRVGEGKGKEIDEMEEKEVEEEEEEKLKEEEGGERKGFIEHKIQRSDTLFKLSLMVCPLNLYFFLHSFLIFILPPPHGPSSFLPPPQNKV